MDLSRAACFRCVDSRSSGQCQTFSAQSHSCGEDFVNAVANWNVSPPAGVLGCTFTSDCLGCQMRSLRIVALGQDVAGL